MECAAEWGGELDPVASERFRGQLTKLQLGAIQIFRERMNQPFSWDTTPPRGSMIFMLFVPTEARLTIGGSEVTTGTLTTVPWTNWGRMLATGAAECIFISVDSGLVADYAQRMGLNSSSREFLCCRSIVDGNIVRDFHWRTAAILQDVASQPDVLDNGNCRAELTGRMLQTLVEAVSCSTSAAQRLPRASTRAYIVDKAIGYMEAHLADPLVMPDVCEAVRVCPRTLRYSFEEVVGVSPTRYLLAVRLSRVRRELLAAGSLIPVHCIAQRYGFWHMGRFAQYYQHAYGERPSHTSSGGSKRTANRQSPY